MFSIGVGGSAQYGFQDEAVSGFRKGQTELLQALQVQIQGLTGVGERLGQRRAAGDDSTGISAYRTM